MNNKELIAIVVAILVLGAVAYVYYSLQEERELRDLVNNVFKPDQRPTSPIRFLPPVNTSLTYFTRFFYWTVGEDLYQVGEARYSNSSLFNRFVAVILQREERLDEAKADELFRAYFSETPRGGWTCFILPPNVLEHEIVECTSQWVVDGKSRIANVFVTEDIPDRQSTGKKVTVLNLFHYV